MKKLFFLLTLVLLGILVSSCGRTNDQIVGKWDDNIKLSQKSATINSNSNSVIITTESTYWWLNGISLNGINADLSNIDRMSKNFTFSTSEYTVERKEDGKKILITMNVNASNSDRILLVSLQNGDYFDGIKITQSK